jgi:alpha-galactosidase
VRAELYRRLGYYPTESSEHHAEYSPWFIGKSDDHGDAIERFHIPIDEYLRRVERNLGEFADTRRKLDAGEEFPISDRSGEYAAAILEAFETGVPTRIVASVMNEGTLIPNLDAGACVEVPCVVDAGGIHPIANGPLPVHLAAYIRGAVDMQSLTVRAAVHRDPAAVPWALMTDPIVQTNLTLDQTWRLAEAMLEAEREWMPSWLQASA